MNIAQSLDNLKLEQDAIVLYDALATIEKDPRRAAAFRHIADNERRHADIWASRLRDLGATVPPVSSPRARVVSPWGKTVSNAALTAAPISTAIATR